MYAWRNWFGSFLKSGDVAGVVTAKASLWQTQVPAQPIAACVLQWTSGSEEVYLKAVI